MAREKKGSASLTAVNAVLVDKVTSAGVGAANLDSVFLAGGRVVRGVLASNSGGVQKVVEVAVLKHESTLFAVVEGLVKGELVWCAGANLQRALHFNLVDVVPERTELQVRLTADGNPVGVDLVVCAVCGDADWAVVGPRTGLHVLGRSHADFRVPGAGRRDHVVHVVGVSLVVYIWGLSLKLVQVDRKMH